VSSCRSCAAASSTTGTAAEAASARARSLGSRFGYPTTAPKSALSRVGIKSVAHFWYNGRPSHPDIGSTMKPAPLIRFRIDFGEHSNIGPGKVELLEGIQAHGSVSQAARSMGMSYRKAWLLLDSVNRSFNIPATVNSVGGPGGGGAEITPFGLLLIERFREVERKLNVVAGEYLKEIRVQVNAERSASGRRNPLSKKTRKGA
jgi:molybdate transport system regulatory protein